MRLQISKILISTTAAITLLLGGLSSNAFASIDNKPKQVQTSYRDYEGTYIHAYNVEIPNKFLKKTTLNLKFKKANVADIRFKESITKKELVVKNIVFKNGKAQIELNEMICAVILKQEKVFLQLQSQGDVGFGAQVVYKRPIVPLHSK